MAYLRGISFEDACEAVHFMQSGPPLLRSDLSEQILTLSETVFFSADKSVTQELDTLLRTTLLDFVPPHLFNFAKILVQEASKDNKAAPTNAELWQKVSACAVAEGYMAFTTAGALVDFLPQSASKRIFSVVTTVVFAALSRATHVDASKMQSFVEALMSRSFPNLSHERIILIHIVKLLNHIPYNTFDDCLKKCFERYFAIQKDHNQLVSFVIDQTSSDVPVHHVEMLIQLVERMQEPEMLLAAVLRLRQLQALYRFHHMGSRELFRLALFIETEVVGSEDIYFDKDVYDLARTLFYEKDRQIFLVNKGKVDILDVRSTFKRVCSAVRIPVDVTKRCTPAVQGVNLDAKSFQLFCEEMVLTRKIQDIKAVAKCLGGFTYRKDKAAMFWDYYPYNLDKLVSKGVSLELQMAYAEDLIEGLSQLHARGVIHGDISTRNVQIATDEQSAKLIDFGFGFDVTVQQTSHYFWQEFGYGSPLAAAPEVLAGGYKTADYKLAEIWSLGMLLYTVYFKTVEPAWADMVRPFYVEMKRGKIVSDITTMRDGILRHLHGLAELVPENGLPDNSYLRLIFRMLNAAPDLRPRLSACLEEIRRLRRDE